MTNRETAEACSDHPVMVDMIEGYLTGRDGCCAELPECYRMRTIAFKHGWRNGRDDRIGKPRDSADVLRRRAEMIGAP